MTFSKGPVFTVVLKFNLFILLLFLLLPSLSEARYRLYGVASLEYERSWFNDQSSSEAFTQHYTLGISGPLLDPRLIIFSLRGDFMDRNGDIYDHESRALYLRVSLLNYRYARGKNFQFLNYLPRPININYSVSESDSSRTTTFGISTSYYLPVYIAFFSDGKIVQIKSLYEAPQRLKFNQQVSNQNNEANGNANGNANANANENGNTNQVQQQKKAKEKYEGIRIPFPYINLDFDRTISESPYSSSSTTWYSTRARWSGPKYDYNIDYNISTSKRYLDDKKEDGERETLEVKTRNLLKGFTVNNELRLTQVDEKEVYRETYLNSNIYRYFTKNQTVYHVSLNGDYSERDSADTKTISYTLQGGLSVSTPLTPLLTSTTGVNANYKVHEESDYEKKDFYSISLSEGLSYRGFRGIILGGGLSGGYSEGAATFGANIGYQTTKWKELILSGEFKYNRYISESITGDEKNIIDSYDFSNRLTYYPVRNLSLNLGVRYSIINVEDANPYSQRGTGLNGGLSWYYKKQRVDLTGYISRSYINNEDINIEDSESKTQGYQITHSVQPSRRTYLLSRFIYDRDIENNVVSKDFSTNFSWFYGKVTFSASYSWRETERGAEKAEEQRIYFKISRYFSGRI